MANGEVTSIQLTFDSEDVDAEGFITLWNFAAASSGRDSVQTRQLAAKLLCFLCSKRYSFVVVSSTDVKYLDGWFERDNTLLYDWSPESDRVDVVAQHACVPARALVEFLGTHKFDPDATYNPRRAVRTAWFNDDWNVG
jgi:hypothetical protein